MSVKDRRADCAVRLYLMLTLEGIKQQNIDLRAIEGAVARVHLPRPPGRVQRASELSFSFVPRGDFSEVVLGPSGQEQLVFKTKNAVSAAVASVTTQT